MTKQINFDLDGTLNAFYNVENWLDYLRKHDPYPYIAAEPCINLSYLARLIHRLQNNGYEVNVISWLSKCSTPEYDAEVTAAKCEWLARHLPSVQFTHIHIVPYGTPKSNFGEGILFDDELKNRIDWNGKAFDADEIFDVLKSLLTF